MLALLSTYRSLLCTVYLLCSAWCCSAQVKTDTLDNVLIRSARSATSDLKARSFAPGQKITHIDSITLQQYNNQSVAQLLSQQAPVFVKSYGFNSLATLSFRGASSAQSQVLWNGIPIQNAALGITDVSLLPLALVDKVSIIYGGSAALWGSGNVGGALSVENDNPHFDSTRSRHLSLSAGTGSFGQYQLGVKSVFSSSRWYTSVAGFWQSADNNFTYTDAQHTSKTLSNSALYGAGALCNAAYRVSDRTTFSLTAWYQQYHRFIPPALFEPASSKSQFDYTLRLLAHWQHRAERLSWYTKVAFLQDDIAYSDAAISLSSQSTARQYIAEWGAQYTLSPHHKFLLFTPLQLSVLDRPLLHDTKQQSRAALAGAYAVSSANYKWNASINARAEVINSISVFLPGISVSYQCTPSLLLRANAQRTYRAPTLNELYYTPWGNENLLPEQGWTVDAGLNYKWHFGAAFFTHDVAVFSRSIRDWIVWLGAPNLTPHNIATVYSRGVETESHLSIPIGIVTIHAGVNTAYVLATTQSSYIAGDGSIGKQIPYTPRYIGQANAGFTIRHWYLNYNHSFTGYRFTTTDESQYLSDYNTANLQLMYQSSFHAHKYAIRLQYNNIFNLSYQVVAFRPMPLSHWLLHFRYDVW